jgi:hypothetical protein
MAEPEEEGAQNLSTILPTSSKAVAFSGYHSTGKGLALLPGGPRNVHWDVSKDGSSDEQEEPFPDVAVKPGAEIYRVFHLSLRSLGDWTQHRWYLTIRSLPCSKRAAMCPTLLGTSWCGGVEIGIHLGPMKGREMLNHLAVG